MLLHFFHHIIMYSIPLLYYRILNQLLPSSLFHNFFDRHIFTSLLVKELKIVEHDVLINSYNSFFYTFSSLFLEIFFYFFIFVLFLLFYSLLIYFLLHMVLYFWHFFSLIFHFCTIFSVLFFINIYIINCSSLFLYHFLFFVLFLIYYSLLIFILLILVPYFYIIFYFLCYF